MTLYELKESLATVGSELKKIESDISAKAANPTIPIEEIQSLKSKKKDVKERFDLLKEQHDELETEQKAKLKAKMNANSSKMNPDLSSHDPKSRIVAAKAELIRSTIRNRTISDETKAALGDNNATGGEKLLPKTVTNELLHEPFVKNPLRKLSDYTGISNLEIPKITFTIDDDDFINDEETAKEIKADGDSIAFGRHKFKVKVPVSETILAGTDTNLVQTVDRALQSGLAAKEKKVAFAVTPKAGEEKMSFYNVSITEISGETKYKSIKAAIADLHEDFRENTSITMRYSDYLDIIETLANGNTTLYNAPPEQVLGKPVEFCDSAVDPIIGDFKYSHFNYDPSFIYDRDKDVNKGIELFVLTAYFDHKIKLKSAFRIAKVVPEV
ncbi:phage major capsid protein [Chengkuizengella marina]|uniref:Phage major capsid protein n=1 Tax=Chengkuizengella marina TaxID=2507566 RepID=A0A6N9Q7V7_9BACL|nr:phage major capsid protein [Chengkuizengella marina]NBI30781.1 phage major capsid protein [Chengkuizengella marina]